MQALICDHFGSVESLNFTEVPIPEVIASDEVLIRVRYCGVNFPDTLIVEGKYQFRPKLPFVPGGEVSGEVVQTGSTVNNLKKGDRVIAAMGWGGFAQFAVAKATNTFKIEKEISLREGAVFLETFGTAIHGLKDRGEVKKGEVIAILGASGGTGNAAIQVGKMLGAKVIAVAGSEEKLAFALETGADHAINYNTKDLKGVLKGLGGIDVVFDPVGGEVSEHAFRALNPFGRHLVVGFASGGIPQLPWNLPLLKSASIVGVFWGHFWRNHPEKNSANIMQLLQWVKMDLIHPKIMKTYALSDGVEALKDLKSRKAIGKIVLEVSD